MLHVTEEDNDLSPLVEGPMSWFLEFLHCILCCVEDQDDDIEYYDSSPSDLLSIFRAVLGLGSSNSSNNRPQSSTTYTTSAPRPYNPPISYTILPQSSSSSSPTPSRPQFSTSYSNRSKSQVPPATHTNPSTSSPATPCKVPTSTSTSKPSPSFTTPALSSRPACEIPASTSSSKPSSSFTTPAPSLRPAYEVPASTSTSKPSPSFTTPAPSSRPAYEVPASTSTSKPSLSFTIPTPTSRPPCKVPASISTSKPSPSFTTPTPLSRPPCEVPASTSTSKPSESYSYASKHPKPSPSLPKATLSSSVPPSPSSKALPTHKVTLSPASLISVHQPSKATYIAQKGKSPIYAIPKDIQYLIKRNQVPHILKMPLCPSTYGDYFASLLYAEDFYIEKWSEFKLLNVTLKLQEALVYKKSWKNTYFCESYEKDDKTFVAFEIDSARDKRPFLLSRDFVIAQPSNKNVEPFKGIIYRVKKSTQVLVEFGEDFHLQHRSSHKYDISFSFNRVCLKRAHQAVDAASDPSFRSFIFPECGSRKSIPASPHLYFCNHKLDASQKSAIRQILCFQVSQPYLIEGPLCVNKKTKKLSSTGLVVQEAVLQIYQSSAKNRILICAPINSTCDVLMRSLKEEIRESDMFRANAAFREIDGVPIDILPSCAYKGDCFTCPSLQELRKFRVILSTFVSSFRLHNEGILAGHFSHIFTVDASSATEPEAMIALANLVDEKTAVIVTGAPRNRSGWVRSDIARNNGLMISYFERLRDSKPYGSLDPVFITKLVDTDQESDDSCSFVSYY